MSENDEQKLPTLADQIISNSSTEIDSKKNIYIIILILKK